MNLINEHWIALAGEDINEKNDAYLTPLQRSLEVGGSLGLIFQAFLLSFLSKAQRKLSYIAHLLRLYVMRVYVKMKVNKNRMLIKSWKQREAKHSVSENTWT